jgi:branched-subunit amino acid ABC-type transport system permease component
VDFTIAVLLAQDGIAQGTIYALLAVALVLVFSVTRIIFVPQGDFVSYGALTIASLQLGIFPGTVWILLTLSIFVIIADIIKVVLGRGAIRQIAGSLALLIYAACLAAICKTIDLRSLPVLVQALVTIAIVAPMGPCIYRIAFEPLAQSSELVLLIAAVAVHFIMVGAGLLAFGAEGFRTTEIISQSFEVGDVIISGQSIAILAFSAMLILVLYFLFTRTMPGKALMATAVNRTGAKLVGIDLESSGRTCFLIAASVGAISGILVSSVTTIYYDSGFLISLKGFVAAIFGGLASYPITALGAIGVGLIESFASFWTSAFKEAVLFLLIIPILLCRSYLTKTATGDRP